MARGGRKGRKRGTRRLVFVAILIAALLVGSYYAFFIASQGPTSWAKPVIMYVNQGNGVVGPMNYGAMLSFAASHGFNTIFFQIYRNGTLLFQPEALSLFVNQTHQMNMKLFFSLYITSAGQGLPSSIMGLHEDGVSLDMSTIDLGSQQSLLSVLRSMFKGETAVTTLDMNSQLKPDLLVLETYGNAAQQYIRKGIVASVGAYATNSPDEYQTEFQYALQNSDGVMVFDYYWLVKYGY